MQSVCKKEKNDILLVLPILLFWPIALSPKSIQLVFYICFCFCLLFKYRYINAIDVFAMLQLAYLLVFTLAIIKNSVLGVHSIDRVAASFNTLLINYISICIYLVYKEKGCGLKRGHLYRFAVLDIIILLIIFGLFVITKSGEISFLGRALCGEDWINGEYALRFIGFLDYPNLVSFFALLFIPLAYNELSKTNWLGLLCCILLILPVKSANSRTGILLILLLLAIILLFGKTNRDIYIIKHNKDVVIVICTIAFLLCGLLLWDSIYHVLKNILLMREGSNSMRLYIYENSITRMLNNSPLTGMGIKDIIGNSGYPYGSHSTYIGNFYKAGILGGLLAIASYVVLIIKVLKKKINNNRDLVVKISIMLIMMLLALEDLDGENWTMPLFYILVALFLAKEGDCENNDHFNDNNFL